MSTDNHTPPAEVGKDPLNAAYHRLIQELAPYTDLNRLMVAGDVIHVLGKHGVPYERMSLGKFLSLFSEAELHAIIRMNARIGR